MDTNKKMTIPSSSVEADVEQSIHNNKIILSQKSENDNKNCLKTLNMDELFDTFFPPREQIVENMLDVGTYLFVGSPKVGKSFFMAQLGYCVSKGLDIWGNRTRRSTVLYLALEDCFARLQSRLSMMYGDCPSEDFHLATISKKLNDGLCDQLSEFVSEHPNTKLIVIDTLKKIRDKEQEQFSYNSDYEIIDNLKTFADKHQLCLLIVHHTRKQLSDDVFDMISGSNGLMGAADGAFVLSKKNRVSAIATLDIVGRDNADQRLTLDFNRETFQWDFVSAENEVLELPKVKLLDDIDELLSRENQYFSGSATELVQKLDDEELSVNTITKKLHINAGRLLNEYNIKFEYARTRNQRLITLSRECVTQD